MSVVSPAFDAALEGAPSRRSAARRLLGAALRRLGSAFIVLWGMVTVTFVVLAVLPGDRATILLNIRSGQAIPRTPQELAPVNALYGFDRPIVVQYFRYVAGLLHGDLGTSFELQRPVATIIGEQIAPTFTLAIAALALAWLIAVLGRCSPRAAAVASARSVPRPRPSWRACRNTGSVSCC